MLPTRGNFTRPLSCKTKKKVDDAEGRGPGVGSTASGARNGAVLSTPLDLWRGFPTF
jgi:hypothetical protein